MKDLFIMINDPSGLMDLVWEVCLYSEEKEEKEIRYNTKHIFILLSLYLATVLCLLFSN